MIFFSMQRVSFRYQSTKKQPFMAVFWQQQVSELPPPAKEPAGRASRLFSL
jgi:hypothetical protein